LQPQVQRQVAFLEDGALATGELLAAIAALPEDLALLTIGVILGRPGANALERERAIHNAAVCADRAVRLRHRVYMSEGGGLIVRIGSG
jgi:hypothetical protein